jgi:iron complex outermembrane recepter protein
MSHCKSDSYSMGITFLRAGIAAASLGLSMAAFSATAPTPPASAEVLEEVVVTGTLIRGAAPTGSNVIAVTQADVAASGVTTTSQLLATIPQIANMFNALPQIPIGSGTQLQVIRPNLRNTPAGNTTTGAATLILVDGHRLVGVGVRQDSPDPDALPPGAIERVEVVTDGGSSTYGADAIGGVINFITRRKFDGIQVGARQGWAENYKTFDASLTAGTDIGNGSIYGSFSYAKHDNLLGGKRSYVKDINWTTGLPVELQCDQPNVRVGIDAPQFGLTATTRPYPALTGSPNVCDKSKYMSLYPAEQRHSFMVGFSQDIGSAVKFDVRAFYSTRSSLSSSGPARFTTAVPFGTPAFISSLFTFPPVQPFLTLFQQNALYTFSSVFGNSADTINRFEELGITPTITWDINDNWQLRGMLNYGDSKSTYSAGDLNANAVTAAVAAGTLNPYNIAATSPAILANIRNWEVPGGAKDKIMNPRVIVEGALADLPGGKLRLAAGAEYFKDEFSQRISNGGTLGVINTVPYSTYSRNVKSAFVEIQVPVVGAGNAMPGLRALNLSLAGRFDKYTDFGNTTNPKFGISYKPLDWVTVRGNWGKSFNPPTPVDRLNARTTSTAFVPIPFPLNPAFPGGGSSIVLLGADANLRPQTAKTYSFGMDFEPPVLPGLRFSASYYGIDYKDALGQPPIFSSTAFFPAFAQYATVCAAQTGGNCSATQIRSWVGQATVVDAQSAACAANPASCSIYELIDFRTYNLSSVKLSGIDFDVSYRHDTGFGSIDARVSGNKQVTHYSKASATTAPVDDLLTGQSTFSMTAQIGANIHNLRAQATLNHTGGYNVTRSATLLQDHVSSFSVLNLYFNYDINGKGIWQDFAVSLNVNNAMDQVPPILRTPQGLGGVGGFANGATVGRLFQVGINKKF